MKKIIFRSFGSLFLFCFLLFTTACGISSLVVKINTSHDQEARFEQYRTYNWYQPNPTSPAPDEKMVNTNLNSHLRKAIEQEIAKKGLQKDADNPQVLLAYDVSMPKPASSASQKYPPGFGYGLASQMGFRYDYGHANIPNYEPVDAYGPGTILIDVIDAKSRKLIWRGWAEEVLENFDTDYKTVENYVDDIIDKYPPK